MSLVSSLVRMHSRLQARQEFPTFEWYGNSVPCTLTNYTRRTVLEVGGFEVAVDLAIWVRKSEVVTIGSTTHSIGEAMPISDVRQWPVAGRELKVTQNGRLFRIEAVADTAPGNGDGLLMIACVDPAK